MPEFDQTQKMRMAIVVLRFWHIETQLQKLSKADNKAKGKIAKEMKELRLGEMQGCFRRRRMRQAWRLTRQCTGTQKGAKRRWGQTPITSNPTMDQFRYKLEKHSRSGGWQARCIMKVEEDPANDAIERVFDEMIAEFDGDAFPTVNTMEPRPLAELVAKHFISMTHMARKQANCKAVPPWGVPVEIWKVLLNPNFMRDKQHRGLGYNKKFVPPQIGKFLRAMMLCHYRSGKPPVQNRFSFTLHINKNSISHYNDDLLGMDVRHICCFDAISNMYVKAQNLHSPIMKPIDSDYGGIANKSREEPIVIQETMAERLWSAKINFALKSFDAINAFNCPEHDEMAGVYTTDHNGETAKDQNLEHSTIVTACDGFLVLEPQTGTPQGGPKATDSYNMYFHRVMIPLKATLDTMNPLLVGKQPLALQKKVNCAPTSFVDDLAVLAALKAQHALELRMNAIDDEVQNLMEANNIYLNKSNEDAIVAFFWHRQHS